MSSETSRSSHRVLLTDRAWPDWELERSVLEPAGVELVTTDDDSESTLIQLAESVQAIGTCWSAVTEKVIRACEDCRVIVRFGIGLDNIAVATATELGIPVCNNPDYCVEEVSDHALALLLAWERKLTHFDRLIRSGRYDLTQGRSMRRLCGRTLGIVGLGRIGQTVARKAQAFGLQVIAYTASGNDHGTGIPMVGSLAELLTQSNYLTLHVPLNTETRGMIGAAELALMPNDSVLINTSRGPLVDERALLEALDGQQLGGACLDVYTQEPPDLTNRLFQHERVMATPHAAFVSEESLVELRTTAAQQLLDGLQRQRPHNVVNPNVYDAVK